MTILEQVRGEELKEIGVVEIYLLFEVMYLHSEKKVSYLDEYTSYFSIISWAIIQLFNGFDWKIQLGIVSKGHDKPFTPKTKLLVQCIAATPSVMTG